MRTSSFRFYGFRPAHWFDIGEYELCFRQPPDDATRAQLANLFEEQVSSAGGLLAPVGEWQWSQRWARFSIECRTNDFFFSRVGSLVHAIHRTWPLEQVVFNGARTMRDDDTWTKASFAEGLPTAGPDPAPHDPRLMLRKSIDPTLPAYARDEVFEQQRARARATLVESLAATRADEAMAKGAIALVALGATPPIADVMVPAALTGKLQEKDIPIVGASGRILVLQHGADDLYAFAWVDDAGTLRATGVRGRFAWVADDGMHALALIGRDAFSVRLDTGVATSLYAPPAGETVSALVALNDGLVAIATDNKLRLVDAREPELGILAEVACPTLSTPVTLRSRTVLAVNLWSKPDKIAFVAVFGRSLKIIGRSKTDAGSFVEEPEGRIIARARGQSYSVENLDRVLATLEPERKKKEAKAAASKNAKPTTVELREVLLGEAPEIQKPSAEQAAKFERVSEWILAPSGRVGALTYQGRNDFHWLDDDGVRRETQSAASCACMRGDGKRALLAQYTKNYERVIREIDLTTGTVEEFSFRPSPDDGNIVGLAYVEGGIVMQCERAVVLLDARGNDRLGEHQLAKGSGCKAYREGRRLVATSSGKGGLLVFRVENKALVLARKQAFSVRTAANMDSKMRPDIRVSTEAERCFVVSSLGSIFEIVG